MKDPERYSIGSNLVDQWTALRAELASYGPSDSCFVCSNAPKQVVISGLPGIGVCRRCDNETRPREAA